MRVISSLSPKHTVSEEAASYRFLCPSLTVCSSTSLLPIETRSPCVLLLLLPFSCVLSVCSLTLYRNRRALQNMPSIEAAHG